MFVNLIFAVAGDRRRRRRCCVNERPTIRPKLDLPGTLSVSAGLFALVYGFNHAQTTSWGNAVTIAFLAAGVVLLAAFVAIEARVAHPLLPLRVVRDRDRGASFLAMRPRGRGDVRRLPVPDLLPAADPRPTRRSPPASRSCR